MIIPKKCLTLMRHLAKINSIKQKQNILTYLERRRDWPYEARQPSNQFWFEKVPNPAGEILKDKRS